MRLLVGFVAAGLLAMSGCGKVKTGADAALPAEVCDDGVDNNGDGTTDCADPECAGSVACVEDCTDGIDNDGDGETDCADSDCIPNAACPEVCNDGIDNDGDNDTDCDDSDCLGDSACPEICDDNIDNDGDANIDCADADCRDAPNCVLYAADGREGTVGSLYTINPATGEIIDQVALNIGVTGLAVHPNGTLYATQAVQWGRSKGTLTANLVTIDPATGQETVIGPLVDAMGTSHGSMPDITFVGEQLLGWTENGDHPVTIDITSGLVTAFAATQNSAGSGLATAANGNVYFIGTSVPGDQLYVVDPLNGTVTPLGAVTATDGDFVTGPINAMTSLNGVVYGVHKLNGGGKLFGGTAIGTELVRIDPGARTVTRVGPLPEFIDGLAAATP